MPPEFFNALAAADGRKMAFDQIRADFSDTLSNSLKSLTPGSAVMQFIFSNSMRMETNSVTIWIGRNNVLLMIGKEEIKSL